MGRRTDKLDKQIRVSPEFDRKIKAIRNERIKRNLDLEPRGSRSLTDKMVKSKTWLTLERELISERINAEKILRRKRR